MLNHAIKPVRFRVTGLIKFTDSWLGMPGLDDRPQAAILGFSSDYSSSSQSVLNPWKVPLQTISRHVGSAGEAGQAAGGAAEGGGGGNNNFIGTPKDTIRFFPSADIYPSYGSENPTPDNVAFTGPSTYSPKYEEGISQKVILPLFISYVNSQ